jgi:hypothetical protein
MTATQKQIWDALDQLNAVFGDYTYGMAEELGVRSAGRIAYLLLNGATPRTREVATLNRRCQTIHDWMVEHDDMRERASAI